MFEVQDLRYATLATVSRCGMVWFSEDVLTNNMIFDNFLITLRNRAMEETEEDVRSKSQQTEEGQEHISPTLSVSRCLRSKAFVLQSLFISRFQIRNFYGGYMLVQFDVLECFHI